MKANLGALKPISARLESGGCHEVAPTARVIGKGDRDFDCPLVLLAQIIAYFDLPDA